MTNHITVEHSIISSYNWRDDIVTLKAKILQAKTNAETFEAKAD